MLVQRRKWHGFTLVELLVVITIIGILIGMVMPAVQSARERARVMECSNKIKEITKAMLLFESGHNVLPVNWGGVPPAGWYPPSANPPSANSTASFDPDTGGPSTVGQSWQTMILPQLDSAVLYNQIAIAKDLNTQKVSGATDQTTGTTITNLTIAGTYLPIFVCPTDGSAHTSTNQLLDTGQPIAVTNYKASIGSNWDTAPVPPMPTAKMRSTQGRNNKTITSVPASNGATDPRDLCNGLICRGWRKNNNYPLFTTSMADIQDGTSATFAVGETLPQFCAFASWYWFNGSGATVSIPLNWVRNPSNVSGADLRQKTSDIPTRSGFMSMHSGGGNFSFCDGHVKFITENIDINTYLALGTIQGGDTVDPTTFSP
jgi:prepilin-type N-terminal cleavage/methylation domain-containing protein/prepilin-type processing-associated H-X9-DG protein